LVYYEVYIMVQEHTGSLRILGATLVAIVLVVGAYVLARGVSSPTQVSASLESELLGQIAAKDTDRDGLRDWEEALYGTDIQKSDSRDLGMTDGEAVGRGLIVPVAPVDIPVASSTPSEFDPSVPVPAPGTLTRALAENLWSAYEVARQRDPDGVISTADIQKITDELFEQLNRSVSTSPDFKKAADLRTTGTTPEDMKIFARSAEAVFSANTARVSKSEIEYLKDGLEKNDATAYAHIIEISELYRKAAIGLAALPVPANLLETDLQLINAYSRLSKVISDLARAESDPIATMLALKQYPDVVKQMGDAYIYVNTTYKTSGVTFAAGEPGGRFVGLVDSILQKQKLTAPTP